MTTSAIEISEVTGFSDLPIYNQFEVLKRVSHNEFEVLCKTSTTLWNLCSNKLGPEHGNLTQRLYQERSNVFFSPEIVDLKNQFNLSWKDFYFHVHKLLLEWSRDRRGDLIGRYKEEYISKNNLLDLLILNTESNLNFTTRDLNTAVRDNALDVVKYLIEDQKIQITNSLDLATTIEMATYLMSKKDYTRNDLINYAIIMTSRNKLEILKWLYNEFEILPDEEAINEAFSYGKTEIIMWLNEVGIQFSTQNMISSLQNTEDDKQTKYNMVKFLMDNGVVPNEQVMTTAMTYDDLAVVKLLYNEYNIEPTEAGMLQAIESDYTNVVIWLFQNGFTLSKNIPTQDF